MAKCRIDNSVRRNAEDQFPFVDSWRESRFRQQPIIRSIVQFENAFERLGIVGQASEDGGAAVSELRGNQAMGIALIDGSGSEHGFSYRSFSSQFKPVSLEQSLSE